MGGNGWRQLNWRGRSREECNNKTMIYKWLVSRSGEDIGVKKIEDIMIHLFRLDKTTETSLKFILLKPNSTNH